MLVYIRCILSRVWQLPAPRLKGTPPDPNRKTKAERNVTEKQKRVPPVAKPTRQHPWRGWKDNPPKGHRTAPIPPRDRMGLS